MNMLKHPDKERFLCGEIRLFVGVLECDSEAKRRHVKSDQHRTHSLI